MTQAALIDKYFSTLSTGSVAALLLVEGLLDFVFILIEACAGPDTRSAEQAHGSSGAAALFLQYATVS